MTFPGALPTVEMPDDYLPYEAPASEPTWPGGEHGPIPIRRLSLADVLESWNLAAWGGDS